MQKRPIFDKRWIKVFRQEALSEQDGTCHYCRSPLTAKTATADHRLPQSKGGKHTKANIAACCEACNQAKADMTEGKFFSAIKKPPTADASFPIMLAWMRRKINLRTHRALKTIRKAGGLDESIDEHDIREIHEHASADLRYANTQNRILPRGQSTGRFSQRRTDRQDRSATAA